MDKSQDVAVTIGSLRKDSTNRKVANALADVAPAELKLSIMEIGHLPIYHQDGDQNPPVAWKEFRGRIKATDAVLFVTPELNRSVPAALKTHRHRVSALRPERVEWQARSGRQRVAGWTASWSRTPIGNDAQTSS